MPPRSVQKTVSDFIFYYYAKLVIAPSAGQSGNYRFIMDRYKLLKNGDIRMSDYDREIQKLAQQPGICAFCGSSGPTLPTQIVPRKLGGPIGIHNLVYACSLCNDSKNDKELWTWWCDELGRDKETLPRIPAGLFLKLAYERHHVRFTLKNPCNDIREIWGET